MIVIAFLVGIALPTLIGWLLLDLVEGRTRLLGQAEKWVMGGVLGMTVSMFVSFFANVMLGIPFTLTGFLMIFGILLLGLSIPWFLWKRESANAVLRETPAHSLSRPLQIVLIVTGGWVALRVIALAIFTLLTPPFFDDSMDNWNLRGKLFFFQKTFSLAFPWDPVPGVSSYPPSLPLAKTWLSTIAGGWHEGLVNSLHPLWFIALVFLVYCALRRMVAMPWAALGAILFASLPLELIHGTNAYADVFLSAHLFIGVMLMFYALRSRAEISALSHLRLAALAIALVPFTKNEGWALYFPVLLLLYGGTLLWIWKGAGACGEPSRTIPSANAGSPSSGSGARFPIFWAALFAAAMFALFVAPWIGFKVLNNLAFGNAKGIDWNLQWQQGVVTAVTVNTFFEGNWGLLFPLFFGLLAFQWRAAFKTPLLLLSAFFLIPYVGQLFAYLTTGLSQEALFQTGYARGLIHLMPVVVCLTMLLLHNLLSGKAASGQRTVDNGQ